MIPIKTSASDMRLSTRAPRAFMWPLLNYVLIIAPLLHWFWSITLRIAPLRIDSLYDRTIIVVPSPAAEAGLWLVGLILMLIHWILYLFRDSHRGQSQATQVRFRMSFLPLLVLVCRILFLYVPALSAHVLYYGVPVIIAWAFTGTLRGGQQSISFCRRRWWQWGMIVVAGSLVYWALGVYFTTAVGEHSGDEGHYLIQARSLFFDHDLDIRNNFEKPETVDPGWVHINPFSRHGKWYSVHSRGLSVLLAFTVPGGIILRHCVLGLIAGLGIGGFFMLCLQNGASIRAAVATLIFLAGSTFWGTYASRALPEILGATLATYALNATLGQKKFPWTSVWITSLAVSFLPWAHTRFVPLAVTIMGCYGMHCLWGTEPRSTKIWRLSVFSLLCIIGLGAYRMVQCYLFTTGGSHAFKDLLFSAPEGLLHVLLTDRGILYTFPVFVSGLVATAYVLIKRSASVYSLFALLYFLSVFLTSCATVLYTGGACVPGRFLIVVTPVIMVSLARVMSNANWGFRALTWYLGLFSITMFVSELMVLPEFGKAFSNPYYVNRIHPLFVRLSWLLYTPFEQLKSLPGIVLYSFAAILLFCRHFRASLQAGILITIAGLIFCQSDFHTKKYSAIRPREVSRSLESQNLSSVGVVCLGKTHKTRNLFSVSNRFAAKSKNFVASVTTQDLGDVSVNNNLSVPHLPVNDWDGRGYRWATLIPPFKTGSGLRAVSLDAQLTGDVSAEFVIREGQHNRVVKKYLQGATISDVVTFEAKSTGNVYILVRLVGNTGSFLCHRLAYTAFNENLLNTANLSLLSTQSG